MTSILAESKSLRRFLLSTCQRDPRLVSGIMVLSACYGLLQGAIVLLVRKISDGTALQAVGMDFFTVCAVLLLAVIGRGGLNILTGYGFLMFSQRLTLDMQGTLFSRLHHLSCRYLQSRTAGDLVAVMTSDIMIVNGTAAQLLGILSRELWVFLGTATVMLYMAPRLTLYLLVCVPPFVFALKAIGRRLRSFGAPVQRMTGELLARLNESVQADTLIKLSNRHREEEESFGVFSRSLFGKLTRLNLLSMISKPISETLVTVAVVLGLLWGAHEIEMHRMDRATLLAFVVALLGLVGPVSALSGWHAAVQRAEASWQRLRELLEAEQETSPPPLAPLPPGLPERIVFDRVSFGYEPDRPILRDISFEVRRGETLALVGRTGQGKSTLIRLLPRLIEPTGGDILIEGRSYRAHALSDLRSRMALTAQGTLLLRRTIFNNIAFHCPDASTEQIIQAARDAEIHNWIKSLPDGYQTIIGEGGLVISGGERQRIGLARELAKNAPILLLDESTSEVDMETERRIYGNLSRSAAARITLLISHRLAAIPPAARIVVLEGGLICEMGTHEELMAKRGIYSSFLTLHDQGIPV